MKNIKSLIAIFLLLIITIPVQAQEDNSNIGITPETPTLWFFDRGIERIQEIFNKNSIQKHELERIKEANYLINKGDSLNSERALNRVRNQSREQYVTANRNFEEKFSIKNEELENIKNRINIELDNEEARKYLVSDAKILFIVKNPSQKYYYSVNLKDHQINKVIKVNNDSGDYDYILEISHGEFYSIQKAEKTQLIRYLSRINKI